MLNRATVLYIACIAVLAGSLYLVLPIADLHALSGTALAGAICFVGVALLAELLAIDFGKGRQARSSLAFLPFLTCAIYYKPIVAIVIVTIVISISNFTLRKQRYAKGIFNVAQVILSVGLGSMAYQSIAGVSATISYLGFAVLAITFFATNILLTSLAIAFLRSEPVMTVLPQVVGPRGSNLWYDLLASPIAVVTTVLFRDHGIRGIVIIILPLLLIRYSYLSKLQLEEANRDLLHALIKAIETRDPYTSGHSVRVATLARAIGRDLNLSIRRVARLEIAALLHDIGKIDAVYSAVIRKPYDLNADERALIRTHATKGAELLESMTSVSGEVISAVRHHHERYDGTGYPDGLSGHSIPLAARIIMVCDSIDAMLSDRPYRRALTLAQVHAELVRCSGAQFDPAIVRLIIDRRTLERAAGLIDSESRESDRRHLLPVASA